MHSSIDDKFIDVQRYLGEIYVTYWNYLLQSAPLRGKSVPNMKINGLRLVSGQFSVANAILGLVLAKNFDLLHYSHTIHLSLQYD